MRVTIASRRSDLARIQAYQVGDALCAAHPQIKINYSFHESLGDKNLNDPLWQMPEKGVFTQDFREGLLRGDFDLVVHSWKDLAIEDDPDTEVVATLPRADARDLVLVRKDRCSQVEASGAMTILTSSPRRAYNLDSFLRDALPASLKQLKFVNVRGNVPTRVRKLLASDVDALIVAKAAIDRLLEAPVVGADDFVTTKKELRSALSQCRWMVMPLRQNPSAPAQGALAVEISRKRDDMRQLIALINCSGTFKAVEREREILRSYGGGCHQKIGASVLDRSFGEVTFLRGITDDGRVLDSCSLRPSISRPPRLSKEALWPVDSSAADWFRRERISLTGDDKWNALWIAKADAFPEDWKIETETVVWASGVQTWKRLARRGVWVNGCAESLGEQEPARIETVAGVALTWLKLTHEGGYTEGSIPTAATYRLLPKNEDFDPDGKRYFFWKSGSTFEFAFQRNPQLKQMTHFCGPGNTQRILQKHGIEPHIFLDHEQWLNEMSL
jgi:hydroxymethylbilane synthase